MEHESQLCYAPLEQKSRRSIACSPANEHGIHAFRVISNISVILFHAVLYWGVLEGAKLQDTLQVWLSIFIPSVMFVGS